MGCLRLALFLVGLQGVVVRLWQHLQLARSLFGRQVSLRLGVHLIANLKDMKERKSEMERERVRKKGKKRPRQLPQSTTDTSFPGKANGP